jgi:hypothetical protein
MGIELYHYPLLNLGPSRSCAKLTPERVLLQLPILLVSVMTMLVIKKYL